MSARPERSASAGCDDEARHDRRDAEDACPREADREQERGGCEDDEPQSEPGAPAVRIGPEREVEQDPRAAGQRQQGEDEPDKRRIDVERRPDAAADAGDHAVVVAAGEGEGRALRHPARITSIRPAPTRASIVRRVLPDPVCTEAFRPSSWRLRMYRSPTFACASTITEAPRGHDHLQLADPEPRPDVDRLVGREVRQVDSQVPDAELVQRLNCRGGRAANRPGRRCRRQG